ncbi:MAG: HNH endonuclease, partial [Alphaproteobacteria bacterium]
ANKTFSYKKTPEGFTWHHHHDGTTMQLVPYELHRVVNHTGGAALKRAKD